jgi:PHD/YefM family antitoxin component YafN of YafNO toxin-antitoxin module
MADMIRVSSTEFGKEVGRYQDAALSQPVVVTRNGRDRTVMISVEEYQRLKRRDRQVFATGDAPEEIVEAVRNSEMDPRHRHLDDLVKDWTP